MKSDIGVAVFARTPGSGGKSRLAETWGRSRTDRFYSYCLQCARDWLQDVGALAIPYWALTGPDQRDLPLWQEATILEQRGGGLGERMADISEQLLRRHASWCLVGTDIPHMPNFSALQLSDRLNYSDFVFAPSSDGGFWLAAGRRPICRHVWNSVNYSQTDTLEQLLHSIRVAESGSEVDTQFPVLTDIDHEADLPTLIRDLEYLFPVLRQGQQQLLQWLRTEIM